MIDPVRELSIRAIAHALDGRAPFDGDGEADFYALQLAHLFASNPDQAPEMARAALILWGATEQPEPIQIHVGEPEDNGHGEF